MKIKLDENLPTELIPRLAAMNHDVDTVPSEQLAGQDDSSVWRAAQKADRFFITQDLDFSDARRFAPGTHMGILLLRLREPSRRSIVTRLSEVVSLEEFEDWSGCFVVVTEHKIRVRRPPEAPSA